MSVGFIAFGSIPAGAGEPLQANSLTFTISKIHSIWTGTLPSRTRAKRPADQKHGIVRNHLLRWLAEHPQAESAMSRRLSPADDNTATTKPSVPIGNHIKNAHSHACTHPRLRVHARGELEHRRAKKAPVAVLDISSNGDGERHQARGAASPAASPTSDFIRSIIVGMTLRCRNSSAARRRTNRSTGSPRPASRTAPKAMSSSTS